MTTEDFISPSEAAKWLVQELDWVERSTRSNIYDGSLLMEPWGLEIVGDVGAGKTDWRVSRTTIADLIARYRSNEWDAKGLRRRRTNAENGNRSADRKSAPPTADAIADLQTQIAAMTFPSERSVSAHDSDRYAQALRVVGEALIALSESLRGNRRS